MGFSGIFDLFQDEEFFFKRNIQLECVRFFKTFSQFPKMNLFFKSATVLTVFHISPLPENYRNFQIQSFFKLFINITKIVKIIPSRMP